MADRVSLAELWQASDQAYAACTEAIRVLTEIRSRYTFPLDPSRREHIRVIDDDLLTRISGDDYKSMGELAAELNVPKSKVQRSLTRLLRSGQVRRHRSGRGYLAVER